jgi:uncharacterized YccA/Bax inhibitor family protein
MKTGNPVLNEKVFSDEAQTRASQEPMTLSGTVAKSFLLSALLVISAGWIWHLATVGGNPQAVLGWVIGGSIGGLILAMITIFKKQYSAFTSPVYAVLEGFCLGGISVLTESHYPGIVAQAVGLTFATLFAMLLAYTSGLIKPTENFKLGVVAATGGIALYYLASIAFSFFSIHLPLINDTGPWGIAFSAFVIVIAALNLVLDFDFIESGVRAQAPKYMEWYGAFGLMVTLVWLYLEILRLLSKARSR